MKDKIRTIKKNIRKFLTLKQKFVFVLFFICLSLNTFYLYNSNNIIFSLILFIIIFVVYILSFIDD